MEGKSRPAAAVIPAPIAYIKVVAVKKLVVGPWAWTGGPPHGVYCLAGPFLLVICCFGSREPGLLPFENLECSKQARREYISMELME